MSALRKRLAFSAVVTRDGGESAQGVKWWFHFCDAVAGISPVQHIESDAPRWLKLQQAQMLCDFAVWLVVCKPSTRNISTRTARKYVGHVTSYLDRVHGAEFAGGIDLKCLRDVLKGMRRELGEQPPRERWGVRTQQLQQALDLALPAGSNKEAQAVRALTTTAFCGLLRGCEVGNTDPSKSLKRSDLRFSTLPDGRELACLMVHQAKNAQQLTGKTTPVFLVSGGKYLDPVRELKLMLKLDPVPKHLENQTPLFRAADGNAYSRDKVAKIVKALMARIGLDPARFGAHSLRIGGASAALAAGVPPAVIRITGRWSSDIWMTYARLSKQAALHVSAVVGSTAFEDCEQAFHSEELGLVASELRRLGDVSFDVDGDGDSGDSGDECT